MAFPALNEIVSEHNSTTSPSDMEPSTPEIVDLSSLLSTPEIRVDSDDDIYCPNMMTTNEPRASSTSSPAMTADQARLLMNFINSAPEPKIKKEESEVPSPFLPRKHPSSDNEPSPRPRKKSRGEDLNIITSSTDRIVFAPTPISPYREITYISAERNTGVEREFRVHLREYWVVESKIPDLEKIRRYQTEVYGKAWEVLS
ncbi:uncharacterized protein K489DRAFT_412407 [Dissoconium aciculare CBS 342.82]|uniref:Uncharacterized protein n=1 Tax=Dissoconium aciculare CBS 342.82 TaxID=1314786 RepID=A0A6J3LVI8_9PEZI|nr:uncharacterized protein K489DRAFT_412407 [Dissoconium aciculare CBS 342.82]KAF1819693.1 hypothetical protein K489DRAFT_412407 [Dissoconium aciculare CBS 342.82]